MPAGFLLSIALHLAVLVIAVVGLPHLSRDPVAPPNAIAVQVVTVGERTAAPPPAEEKVQPKKVEETAEIEPAQPKQATAVEPAEAASEAPSPPPLPAEAAAQPAPPPPPEQEVAALPPPPSEPEVPPPPPEPAETTPDPTPKKPEPPKEAAVPQAATTTAATKAKPKPPPLPKAKPDRPEPVRQAESEPEKPKPAEPKPEVAKKAEPKRDEFAALENLVENMQKPRPVAEKPKKQQPKPPEDELASISSALEPRVARSITSSNLTISEIDALRRQLEGCWIVPVGAKDAENLTVEIRVRLDQQGTVRSAEVVDGARMARDPFFRAAAESAQRAVHKCSPLRVPKDKFSEWQDMTLTFDPRDFVS